MSENSTKNAAYMRQVNKIVKSLELSKMTSFNQARKAIFNSAELRTLVEEKTGRPVVALSAGTSQAVAFGRYFDQIDQDLRSNTYYRDYTPTAGNVEARQALALLESQQFQDTNYDADDICLTEGSTGAITAVFEALQRSDHNAEVVIASPAYYLYKLAAEYFGLPYTEVNLLPNNIPVGSSPLAQLTKRITPQTKLVVVCNPSNPGGELYAKEDIACLLQVAKAKNILVMADELFAELAFERSAFQSFAPVAEQLGVLDNLITIKGYSKSKNLAGLRIGYALSKNKEFVNKLLLTLEQRQCFPVASMFTGLIELDAFVQYVVQQTRMQEKSLKESVALAQQQFGFCEAIRSKSSLQLQNVVKEFVQYSEKQARTYSELYNRAVRELGELVTAKTQTQAAFNTFVKIEALQGVDQLDFTLQLYLQTGVKIEIGPCFGWTQQQWQEDESLGFWLRLSFSQPEAEYLMGIKLLKDFIKKYLKN